MPASIRKQGDIAILELQGRLLLGPPVDDFRGQWSDALAAGTRNFIVNLSAVPMMDSSGIGGLLRCQRAVSSAGGKLRLVGANAAVRQALRITRLESLFEFHDTEESALSSLRAKVQ